jgi:CubicO group peptidase (beta-lactamase class C family)
VLDDGGLNALRASLAAQRVPGAALVAVSPDGTVSVHSAGTLSATPEAATVDAQTVFEGASFGKPCFALAVLKLAHNGEFPLDEPLRRHSQHLKALGNDARTITARHLLSHTSGLPNVRSAKRPFRVWFPPGERFSYSSEGYVCLQQAAEAITGKSAEQLAQALVFEPLRMQRTSYVWQPRFEENYALPHDGADAPDPKSKPESPNAAGSLHTTAADYGLFLRALLGGKLLEGGAESWLAPVVAAPAANPMSIDAPSPLHPELSWGLGWGLIPASSLFLHWGANPGFRALVVGSLQEHRAIAVFTNAATGLRVAADTAARTFPEVRELRAWLGIT